MQVRWDGPVPESARRRLERAATSGLRTSLLSVPGTIGLDSVGLEAAGEVMGCCAEQLGWSAVAYGSLGAFGSLGGLGYPPTIDFGPYEQAVYGGYGHALDRMVMEAQALGADGVVDVRLTADRIASGIVEYVALGTAVRARSTIRPRTVFTTVLPGQDVAKLMKAGWVPARIAIGFAVASRYLDVVSSGQTSFLAGNSEVAAHTAVVTDVRARARAAFHAHAAAGPADVALVSSMDLRTWDQEIKDSYTLLCAESLTVGGTVACFSPDPSTRPRSLTLMPLNRGSR